MVLLDVYLYGISSYFHHIHHHFLPRQSICPAETTCSKNDPLFALFTSYIPNTFPHPEPYVTANISHHFLWARRTSMLLPPPKCTQLIIFAGTTRAKQHPRVKLFYMENHSFMETMGKEVGDRTSNTNRTHSPAGTQHRAE